MPECPLGLAIALQGLRLSRKRVRKVFRSYIDNRILQSHNERASARIMQILWPIEFAKSVLYCLLH